MEIAKTPKELLAKIMENPKERMWILDEELTDNLTVHQFLISQQLTKFVKKFYEELKENGNEMERN